MSTLSELMTEAFPVLKDKPPGIPQECWALKAQHQDVPMLSRAIESVAHGGQLKKLIQRLRNEHPMDRPHLRQYDDRLLDCLTEACAFAWATSRGLGHPRLCHEEGMPDICVNQNLWIEAKAIHRSQESADLAQKMAEGHMVRFDGRLPDELILGKFESQLADAKRKFQRRELEQGIVFFNLTWVDDFYVGVTNDVLAMVRNWAAVETSENPCASIVLCHKYQWMKPLFDPYEE